MRRKNYALGGGAALVALLALSGMASGQTAPVNKGAKPAVSESMAIAAPSAVDAPRPNPTELVYTPITPCRVFYTPTAIASGTTRNLQITGSGNLASQGGPSGGCGIPASASAVAINFTVVNPSATGHLKAVAGGSALPTTVVMAYRAGINDTTGAIVGLNAGGQMSVFARATTQVVGDITGYYAPQIIVYMNPTGTPYAASTRILATSKLGTGSYKIDVDRNLQLCTMNVTISGGYYYASAYPSGSSIYVTTWSLSTTGSPPALTQTPVDLYYTVSAHC